MRFEWRSFATVAGELLDSHGDSHVPEACFRTAISRAYYAVFCTASEHLQAEGTQIPRSAKAHSIVRKQFEASNDMSRRSIGSALKRLGGLRHQADYDCSPAKQMDNSLAQLAVLMAHQTLTDIDGL